MIRQIFLTAMLCLCCGCGIRSTTVETDQERIEEIRSIAAILEEYQEKFGRYPFREMWEEVKPGYQAVPVVIVITDQELSDDMRYPPGMSCRSIPKNLFEQYLTEKLARTIVLPTDSRPIKSYNMYQFMFDGRDYFLSCILDVETERTRKLAQGRHKYQVSSTANPSRMIWKYNKPEEEGLQQEVGQVSSEAAPSASPD